MREIYQYSRVGTNYDSKRSKALQQSKMGVNNPKHSKGGKVFT